MGTLCIILSCIQWVQVLVDDTTCFGKIYIDCISTKHIKSLVSSIDVQFRHIHFIKGLYCGWYFDEIKYVHDRVSRELFGRSTVEIEV